MQYVIGCAVGIVLLGSLLLLLEHLRTRKPKVYPLCGASFSTEPNSPTCTLWHNHSGLHGAVKYKTNIWWEKTDE